MSAEPGDQVSMTIGGCRPTAHLFMRILPAQVSHTSAAVTGTGTGTTHALTRPSGQAPAAGWMGLISVTVAPATASACRQARWWWPQSNKSVW